MTRGHRDFLPLLAAFALASCVSTAAVQQTVATGKAECDARHARGELTTVKDRAACLNDVERAAYVTVPDADLMNLRYAARLAYAEKVDAGAMTDAEAQLAFAQLMAELSSESIRRQQGRQAIAAQRAAIFQRYLAQTNTNRTVNCTSTRMGTFVNTTCN